MMVVGTATSFIFGASDIDDLDDKLFVPPIAKLVAKRQKSKKAHRRETDLKMEEIPVSGLSKFPKTLVRNQ